MKKYMFLLIVVISLSVASQTAHHNNAHNNSYGTQIEKRNNIIVDDPFNKVKNTQIETTSIKSTTIKLGSENGGKEEYAVSSRRKWDWLVEQLSGVKVDSVEYYLQNGQLIARSIIEDEQITNLINNRQFFIYVEYGTDLKPSEYCVVIRNNDILQIVWNWYEMPNSQKHFCFPSDNNVLIDAFDILQTLKGPEHIEESEINLPEFKSQYKLVWTQCSSKWHHAYFAVFDENYSLKIDWIDNAVIDMNHFEHYDAIYLFDQYIKGFINSCWYGTYREPVEIHY